MFDYKLLEAFAMVVDEGGFQKAADKLHLTQSAVSQRVRRLEEEVGGVLLARADPPAPTDAGRPLLRHYRRVKHLEDDLLNEPGPPALGNREFTTLAVGLNADSLAAWFLPAVAEHLAAENILLDLSVDDQDRTHELLKNGDVLGCVSSRPDAFQGCRTVHLGDMDYRLAGATTFRDDWFPHGLAREAAERAPLALFNRRDELHLKLFAQAFDAPPERLNVMYVPSSESVVEVVASGLACGMLPDAQSREYMEDGAMADLAPGDKVRVRLYWHCWNLESGTLSRFSEALRRGAARVLGVPKQKERG